MDIDLPRLHRYLMAHATFGPADLLASPREQCVDCYAISRGSVDPADHAPDCEWVALVAMTKGEGT